VIAEDRDGANFITGIRRFHDLSQLSQPPFVERASLLLRIARCLLRRGGSLFLVFALFGLLLVAVFGFRRFVAHGESTSRSEFRRLQDVEARFTSWLRARDDALRAASGGAE
jgi:hypothetical protein